MPPRSRSAEPEPTEAEPKEKTPKTESEPKGRDIGPQIVPYRGKALVWHPHVEKARGVIARTIEQDIVEEPPLREGERSEDRFLQLWAHYQRLNLPVDRALMRAIDETTHAILLGKARNPRLVTEDEIVQRLIRFYTETIKMPPEKALARAASEVRHAYPLSSLSRVLRSKNPPPHSGDVDMMNWIKRRLAAKSALSTYLENRWNDLSAQANLEQQTLGRVTSETRRQMNKIAAEMRSTAFEMENLARHLSELQRMHNPAKYRVEKIAADPPGTFAYRLKRVPGRDDILLRFAIYRDAQGHRHAKVVSKLRKIKRNG
jgi:hypothetical protein